MEPRVFVVWDSRLKQVAQMLAALKGATRQGVRIEALGAPGDVPLGSLKQRLDEALGGPADPAAPRGVLAFVDHANANMAWELGYALALGHRVMLATEGGAPGWVADTPFAMWLRQHHAVDTHTLDAVLGTFAQWPRFGPPRARPARRTWYCTTRSRRRRAPRR